jgi:hypothetical protein
MCIICEKRYNDNSRKIDCCEDAKKLPNTLDKLRYLKIRSTYIKKIPKTLINLKLLICNHTQIKFIPETLKNLDTLYCNSDVLVSPQTRIKKTNNKKYLTFTRCQKNYKYKLKNKNLKFAYDSKYIIRHTIKKQLEKLFTKK